MQIIDGRKIKDEILKDLKDKVEALPFPPIFCDILVGDDTVSASYVRIKGKAAESVGIKFRTVNFPKGITTEEVVEEIENLNHVPLMCGIIVQLPLPAHIDTQTVLDAIYPKLDVDCLGKLNNNNFYNDTGSIGYPTALACMKLLETLHIDLKDKNIVVLGQGKLVGLPVTHLLKKQGLNVSVVNSQTENVDTLTKEADLIISAIGRGKFITGDMVKDGVVIVDAGTSEENGSVVGDVDMESVGDRASFITPTPGGVGPVTVAMLLENVYQVAKNKNE
ncbi:MAG: Bifunctional protein FolD [Candidatus Nomurabacteria bacterium GW2011_GWF2_35_66]|uniref:Bifunctional protein FolD n=1 Tax=Candidatus Nomurabacteria bacterium GW2011_GWE1_35_16 TaxID=1618761 RepID=A0A0G0BSR1_9BACT|nr:MAG: Bifunctional protein FolD [Candidatus Nomurabacteria bacterium GW2011_GWF1_34_20]KKP63519.1 MAG: Bifunctional protein FolD [Candidatus Nomurabacteria bacterium GW2011_GWE2_34_25]KKP66711.1 MAG: Bifunctional protein FolD [Candidatus Nomurabacteria bacterium GW2011_GWE1_35_16]KKP83811.1 MAG: Bifunctional protein FolD [Candidatus Nomurabacteria bacterium GW2011_GWF2_35_66]HAE36399.1 bifunctional methylenetetrahydrofolate dehydrogenase/methenyltetrahydrofolate cyclohydrolase [Candidatus Nom